MGWELRAVYSPGKHTSRMLWWNMSMSSPPRVGPRVGHTSAGWPAAIPRHIHLTCRRVDQLLAHPARLLESWRALHPGFTVSVHGDDDVRAFLTALGLVAVHDAIPQWAGPIKADLWRAAYLFVHGGVYVDDDVDPFLPLTEIVSPADRLVVSSSGRLPRMLNGNLIISAPAHPILNETLSRMTHALVRSLNIPHQLLGNLPFALNLSTLAGQGDAARPPEIYRYVDRHYPPTGATHQDKSALGLYWSWSICSHMYMVIAAWFRLAFCPLETAHKTLQSQKGACRVLEARRAGVTSSEVRLLKEVTIQVSEAGRLVFVTIAGQDDRRVVYFNHLSGQNKEKDGSGTIWPETRRWRERLCPATCLDTSGAPTASHRVSNGSRPHDPQRGSSAADGLAKQRSALAPF